MQKTTTYAALDTLLNTLGHEDEAAGYHGALCGALCVKPVSEIDPTALIEADAPTEPDADARRQLLHLRDEALVSLQNDEGGFAPLLPEDDADLALRIASLVAWCEGFLFGLSSRAKLDLQQCSEEAREIIADFAEFTRASLDDGDDSELEENAYAELVEYIRVGAQLIYMELRPRPTPDPSTSQQVH